MPYARWLSAPSYMLRHAKTLTGYMFGSWALDAGSQYHGMLVAAFVSVLQSLRPNTK